MESKVTMYEIQEMKCFSVKGTGRYQVRREYGRFVYTLWMQPGGAWIIKGYADVDKDVADDRITFWLKLAGGQMVETVVMYADVAEVVEM